MQALLFRCACGAGLKEPNAEHATHVWRGEVFCSSRCLCAAQTRSKCSELGIGGDLELFQLPSHTGGP